VDSLGNLYELGRRAPALVRRAVRFIAGGRDLLLTCTIDGALEVRRDDAVVLRRGCLRTLSPEMMAVAGDSFAAVTAPHVLTVSRGGRTFDAPTEIAGEYELAMSEAGVVVLADYNRGGRSSYMRADGEVLQPGPVHDAPLYCVAAGGRFAAWGYRDGMVIALDTISGAVWTLRGHPDAAFHMVFVGDMLLTASAYEVRVWDLKAPPVTYVGQLPCLSRALQLSPDGAYVGLDCNGGAVWLWTRASGALVALHTHDKSSVGVAWLGDQLCSIGWDGRAVCSTPDGRTTRAYETGGGKLRGLTASPDHSFVVFASPDGRIWKLDDELRELYSQEAVPAGVALAPGGTLLASGGLDGSLIVFDLATRRIVSRIVGHRGAVSGLGWRGDLLWSTGLDGTLRWWALHDGGLQPREVVHEPARIRLARVFAAGWAADVREGVLRIQSDDAPPLRFDLDKHIDSIDVSPDERYVAAGVRGEIVVVDRSRNRIATLNLESENGWVTFLDSSTLALNAAGTIGLVPVNELDYLPFVAVPGG
ncbi:MAG TPA: WD40 repeat domain-containing protein, partial [Kofleriaceae bacterium]